MPGGPISGGSGGSSPDASTTVKGIGKTATAPAVGSNPIFVGDNDPRNNNSRAPTTHAVDHAPLGADIIDFTLINNSGSALPGLPNGTYPSGTFFYRTTDKSLWLNIGGVWSLVTASGLSGAGSGTPTLGALQTNVASQFIAGTNSRMYFRSTYSATPVGIGNNIALVSFSAALASVPYITVTDVSGVNLYGDSVTTTLQSTETFTIDSPTTSGFTIKAKNSALANAILSCIIDVLT